MMIYRPPKQRGFALVVSLAVMILPVAGIELRSSGRGGAVSVANANVRLVVMSAPGDLQKCSGPCPPYRFFKWVQPMAGGLLARETVPLFGPVSKTQGLELGPRVL